MVGNPEGRKAAQRACVRCGAELRRGRTRTVCDPCARRPNDVAEQLREAEFFTREPIRKALAAYDFGYLFRAVRRTADLTQVQLGEVLGLDQDRISRIERGERQLRDIETIARIATRLGIPPTLLGFSADPASVPAQSAAAAPDPQTDPAPTADSVTPSTDDGAKSDLGSGVSPLPALTPSGPVSDIAALFVAHLALCAAAAQGMNTGKGYTELLASVRRWVDRMNRRGLLELLGVTTTSGFVPPLLDGLDPDEQERVVAAMVTPERVDAQVITHIESVLFDAFVSNDKLGPRAALHTVLGQQKILQGMTAECPDELRPRLLPVFGHSLRLAGWISFTADDLPATRRYYERARVAAQDTQDVELATQVLAALSQAAESSGSPAMAVDYAAAAQTWAARAHNACLSAYAFDVGACAFAAMGDDNAAMRHLEGTQAYLPECSDQSPSTFYRYSDGLHVARRGQCLLALGRTADAVHVIGESLRLYAATPSPPLGRNINIAVGKLELSTAHVQAGDIEEGAATLADVADFVSQNRADRLVKRLRSVRATLEPWRDTAAVKQLDDQLHESGLRP